MDTAQLIGQLAYHGKVPVEAIHAARADWPRVAPAFVEAIEQFVSGRDRSTLDSLWIIFHLFGERREKSAYRSLARLLRCPPDDVEAIFSGALTDTIHRVMAAVFDGDPEPLYKVILDPDADEFVRSRMLEAIAMVTLNGDLPREEASRFLRACYSEIRPRKVCFVWEGWQRAIALLGLAELKPLVEQAFARGSISRFWLEPHHFEEDLRKGIEDPTALPREAKGDYDVFGDTIEELSQWDSDEPLEAAKDEDLHRDADDDPSGDAVEKLLPWDRYEPGSFPPVSTVQAVNPHKNVGRNDPCPCGSGRKFKKCCLTATA